MSSGGVGTVSPCSARLRLPLDRRTPPGRPACSPAATLLAEIGEDRDHYPAVGVLLAEAGLAPVTRSSGRSHRVGFRYAANTRLREACTWWAYNSLKTSPWARAAY